ncbi:MAG: response regulator transcription factor, partial [Leptospiraceae bacterium]|nr:response regulator transcription factor [Leptospiraceae bacterium]
DLLLLELKVIMMGGATLTPRVADRMAGIFNTTSGTNSTLSDRESEVLKMISLGFKYNDIADELDISPHTVRRHIEWIYKKLDVNSKSEAIIKGRRQGLLSRFLE